MSRTELQHVRDWLKALGSLCGGSTSAADASGKIAAYAPLLAAEFSQAAFGPASLAHVARQCEFFPSYAKLCEYLAAWWRDNRPPPSAHLLTDPKARTHEEWREMAEQSWRDISAGQVRAKIVDIQRVGGAAMAHPTRSSLGRMLAHAIATHAPHHAGLLPPEWIET